MEMSDVLAFGLGGGRRVESMCQRPLTGLDVSAVSSRRTDVCHQLTLMTKGLKNVPASVAARQRQGHQNKVMNHLVRM